LSDGVDFDWAQLTVMLLLLLLSEMEEELLAVEYPTVVMAEPVGSKSASANYSCNKFEF
jgi:hypothetical protein